MANVDVQLLERTQRDAPSHLVGPPPVVLRAKPSRYSLYIKRPFDVLVSALGLLLLAPLLMLLAALVRINLGPGGVIYRQQRVGRNGQSFEIYKFRSMLPDRRQGGKAYIGPERRKTHKSADDPRHTRFGRFLRASSLDELPQLINVIKGDMSLIGPRPELVSVAAREGFLVHPRHLERPGITGRFQVSELRAKNRISAGLHLDVSYVANIRFRSDLAILVKTMFVLFGPGQLSDRHGRRRILFVCTANICRSPTAELLSRNRFGESTMLFRSAGFLDPDQLCPPELVEVLGDRHVDATAHRSYQLDKVSTEAADLLLTMEGSHVQQATMVAPDSFPKIVPIREAADVIERSGRAEITIEEFVTELAADRDPRDYLGTKWDVDDPYGGRVKAYRKAVAQIDELLTAVVGRLR